MHPKYKTTIFSRLFIPLFVVMLLQSAIFYIVTVHGGVVEALNQNAIDILKERVDNRQNELESQFAAKWTNMSFYSEELSRLQGDYSRKNALPLDEDTNQQKAYLLEASPVLFTMLRNNAVTGDFLILDSAKSRKDLTETESFYGLCIRDYDLKSGYSGREDLLMMRCPSSLTDKMGCALDSYWEANYSFDPIKYTGEFFYKPIQAARDNPGVSGDNLAYLCGPHTCSDGGRPVISYSVPLIGSDGEVYGVLGVELLTTYLASLLPSTELDGENSGAYMLVQYEEDGTDYRIVAGSGTLYQRFFFRNTSFPKQPPERTGEDDVLKYCTMNGVTMGYCISPLSVYNRNTPFEKEILALAGFIPEDQLFAVSSDVRYSLIIVMVMILLIGCLGILIVSHLLARPIKRLAGNVRNRESKDRTELEHVNIQEIDQLVDAIENQERKISQSQVRSEFFSRMSHDMRTPMNAIIGFSSEEVLNESSPEEMRNYLEKINDSGKYLLGLINEVLDMTKIDSGHMELNQTTFELSQLWQGIIPMIEELAEKRKIHFVKQLPNREEKYYVEADAQRLSQVIVNLLSNAVKFTPKGGTVTLEAQEQKLLSGHILCQITVKDTGIGMSAAFLEKLFQPFAQEHPNRDGTGLGLSIAQQLVKLMGGKIECRSRLGKGTEFVVSLVLDIGEPVDDAVGDDAVNLADVLAGRRILLCEDQPLNRKIAERLLENMKIQVEMAENGKAGCDMFSKSELGYYDLILMDIRMPVMDGLEAARTIRSMQRADAKKIPILAMTANAFKEDMEASAEAGMNAHLSKPIEPQKLYQELAKWCSDGRTAMHILGYENNHRT